MLLRIVVALTYMFVRGLGVERVRCFLPENSCLFIVSSLTTYMKTGVTDTLPCMTEKCEQALGASFARFTRCEFIYVAINKSACQSHPDKSFFSEFGVLGKTTWRLRILLLKLDKHPWLWRVSFFILFWLVLNKSKTVRSTSLLKVNVEVKNNPTCFFVIARDTEKEHVIQM